MAPFSDRSLVLLDAGGTLITLDYARIRTILGEVGVQPDDAALDEAEARARRWADAGVREKLGMRRLWEGYFGRIMRALGVPEERLADRIEALWQTHHTLGLWRRPIPGALEVVRGLHEAGRRLAVVSNAEGQVEEDLEEAGFGPYLETVVDSHVVGVSKPDPRIFEICLERLGARARDAIYVGDVPAFDVDGARAAGIDPVLIDPFEVHDDVEVTRIRALGELRGLLGITQGETRMDRDFKLATPRLVLRPLVEADAPFILALQSEEGWKRFIGDRGVHDLASARAYISKGPVASYAEHGYGLLCVEERASSAPVGLCGLVRRPSLPGPDLGFAILEAQGGRGFATESCRAVLAHAERELGIREVLAITSPDNHASMAVLAKLGFREEESRVLEGESAPVRVFARARGEGKP